MVDVSAETRGVFMNSMSFVSAFSLLAAAALSSAAQAETRQNLDLGYFMIGSVETYEIHENGAISEVRPFIRITDPVGTVPSPTPSTSPSPPTAGTVGTPSTPSPAPTQSIDGLLALGKQIWDIIAANRPVVTTSTERVSVVPPGITDWQDLEGWDRPQMRSFRSIYRNIYGVAMVDFEYRVMFTPKGRREDGKGAFLSGVTILPSALEVGWGYTFNAKGTVASITNAGSRKNPIAAVEIQMQWTLDTIFKHDERSFSYYVRGDGVFQEVQ